MVKEKEKIYRRLKNKFRLVIINDDSFEQKFSMILSPLNVVTWGGIILLLLIIIISSTIAFTPLREYIPGYADAERGRMVAYSVLKADSIQEKYDKNEQYLANIRKIISGEITDSIMENSNPSMPIISSVLKRSKEDSLLRLKIEQEDKYSLNLASSTNENENIHSLFLFTPVNGIISAPFDLKIDHFGIDIIAVKETPIKSIMDGKVILATWSYETGYIIQIQHDNNLVSVYKHNASLLKKEGEQVKLGEPIAFIGNSGEFSSGPHLHFELWHKGEPLNPENYMLF